MRDDGTLAELAVSLGISPAWIAVSEKVPKPGQAVVYYSPQCGAWVGKYDGKGRFGHKFSSFGGYLEGDVTHWFPMPGKPRLIPKSERVAARAS